MLVDLRAALVRAVSLLRTIDDQGEGLALLQAAVQLVLDLARVRLEAVGKVCPQDVQVAGCRDDVKLAIWKRETVIRELKDTPDPN